MKTEKIQISRKTVEKDIVIVLPDNRKVTIQYRNYEGEPSGEGATLDVILPEKTPVTCWEGSDMKPAKASGEHHIRNADQLMVIL